MTSHVFTLLHLAVRECPTPNDRRNVRSEQSPQAQGWAASLPGLHDGQGPLSSGQLPGMQTSLSACLIHKQLKTRLS